MHKSHCRGASPPLLNRDLHAIDAIPARRRGIVVYCRSFQPTRPHFRRERNLRPTHSLIYAQVYGLLNWIGMNTLDGVPHTIILEYKKLTKLVVTLNNHPKIKAWNAAKNPKLPWYEPGV